MTLQQFLYSNGPALTQDIKKALAEEGLSDEAFRKRLQRASTKINKLRGLFTDDQCLYYLPEQFGTPEYYDALLESMAKAARHYYSVLAAIMYHKGFVRKNELASYCAVPVGNIKTHKNFDTIITHLINLRLIQEQEEYYVINPYLDINTANYNYAKSIQISKDFLKGQFYDYCRSMNMASADKGQFEGIYSNFQFNYVAPSYITGLISGTGEKPAPAFIVADILIGGTVDIDQVDFFIKKIAVIKQQRHRPFLPYLIVHSGAVQHDAFKLLKKHGVIIGFINKLFGSESEKLLDLMVEVLTNVAAVLRDNPDKFLELVSQLTKFADGKVNNLRGDLFELAVAYYYSKDCRYFDVGYNIYTQDGQREIDVRVVQNDQIIYAECKAYKSPLDIDFIEKWLTQKIPFAYKWQMDKDNELKVVFELWSPSGFTDEAFNRLEKAQQMTKKYSIKFYNKEDILQKAKDSHVAKIQEIMREYFVI